MNVLKKSVPLWATLLAIAATVVIAGATLTYVFQYVGITIYPGVKPPDVYMGVTQIAVSSGGTFSEPIWGAWFNTYAESTASFSVGNLDDSEKALLSSCTAELAIYNSTSGEEVWSGAINIKENLMPEPVTLPAGSYYVQGTLSGTVESVDNVTHLDFTINISFD
jgi:hypothetical protein